MKKIIKITGITLLIAVLAVPALVWAQGRGRGGAQRVNKIVQERLANLTPEQQEKLKELKELRKKFTNKTADTRNEMMKKYIDLRAIIQSDKPDVGDAKAIQKDISKLQAKIAQARIELIIEAKKIAPDRPFGRGFRKGAGMRGMRRGMRPNKGMMPGM